MTETADGADRPRETGLAPHWPEMTGQAVSDLLGVSPQWIAKLEKEGLFARRDNRLFDAGEVLLGYIRWLKDDARRSTKTDAARRKEEQQIEKLRIENARARGELVDLDTIAAFFAELFMTLRNEIDGVPAGATRDLALRGEIETRLDAAFARCRAKFDAHLASLRSGQLLLEPEAD